MQLPNFTPNAQLFLLHMICTCIFTDLFFVFFAMATIKHGFCGSRHNTCEWLWVPELFSVCLLGCLSTRNGLRDHWSWCETFEAQYLAFIEHTQVIHNHNHKHLYCMYKQAFFFWSHCILVCNAKKLDIRPKNLYNSHLIAECSFHSPPPTKIYLMAINYFLLQVSSSKLQVSLCTWRS